MKTDLANLRDAYWVFIYGALCGGFAINHFITAKTIYDDLLVLMLLVLGYFFIHKAFRTSSLSYERDLLFMRKIDKKLNIPFNQVLEIKREKGTVSGGAPMSFGYRIIYTNEEQKKSYSIVFVRTDKITDLEILMEKIKKVNPALVLNL